MKWLLRLAAVVGLLLLAGCSGGNGTPANPPSPVLPVGNLPPVALPPSRRGLYFGYYGASENPDEIIDHCNLWFECGWEGEDAVVTHLHAAKLPTILTVTNYMFESVNGAVRYLGQAEAKSRLRSLLTRLRDDGVLGYVIGLYPIDEPDLYPTLSEADLTAAVHDARQVAAEFSELAGVKMVCTYTGGERYKSLHAFDWIGFDDYGVDVFASGKLDRLKQLTGADQQITLFPGGAEPWREDPRPMFAYAQQDPQVVALIPFIWRDQYGQSGQLGIHGNGTAEVYKSVGRAIRG